LNISEDTVARIVSDLKEAAVQSDRDCVSSVVGFQFGKDVADMSLDGDPQIILPPAQNVAK
jgi:hypothetical protein